MVKFSAREVHATISLLAQCLRRHLDIEAHSSVINKKHNYSMENTQIRTRVAGPQNSGRMSLHSHNDSSSSLHSDHPLKEDNADSLTNFS
jgi:hypothetical protein